MKIALIAMIALLAGATTARASSNTSTTLGQLANSTHAACETKRLYLQTSSASGLSSYTVSPPAGIITSWSETPLQGAGEERLVLAAPTATTGLYTLLAASAPQMVAGTETQTFPAHIPVQAGDILGLEILSGSVYCTFPNGLPTGTEGDLVQVSKADPAVGESFTVESQPGGSGERLNVTALLQPDADHDGYGDVTEDGCPTDPSTHEACPIPLITGTAALGQTLTANPEGSPENPSYAWLRCGAGGSGCYAIPGATGLSYTLTYADIGHTLRFRKTATNSQDTQITESAPTALTPFASAAAVTPRLTSVSQSASHWREGSALARYASSKSPLGTVFRFAVNLPVAVTLSFTQKQSGRISAGKCTTPTKHNRHARACTHTVTLGALHTIAHVGMNKVSFQGRISRSQKLSPGLYTVLISAGWLPQHSVSHSLTFRILPA